MKRWKIKRSSNAFFVVLFLLWISLADSIRLDEIIIGLAATLLVVVLTHHLFFEETEVPDRSVRHVFLWIRLLGHLLKEIVIANLSIANLVLRPKLRLQPQIFRVKTSLQSVVLKTLYCNSITLTPGTLTIDIQGDEILVHGLTDATRKDLESGTLEVPFLALEKRK
jgi:multicomponent Na+:H+ antiporter subunit E